MKRIIRSPVYQVPLDEVLPGFLRDCGKTNESQLDWEEDLRGRRRRMGESLDVQFCN